jgi:hypothetical protein
MTTTQGTVGAVPDFRYARGVSAGALADLVALGRHGVRWRQAAVITIGICLSGNTSLLDRISALGASTPFDVLQLIYWPVIFMFSAIIAVRSFQGGLRIALFTGLLYSLLNTSVQCATRASSTAFPRDQYWMSALVSSFSWAALTMLALHFAVSGSHRWMRLAAALMAVSIAHTSLISVLYFGTWDVAKVAEIVTSTALARIVGALLWTLTFWVAHTKFRYESGVSV